MILWKDTHAFSAGTTLRDPLQRACNSMALHCGEDDDSVLENRKMLADMIHVPMKRFVFANQTHSDHLYEVCEKDIGKGAFSKEDAIQDCDALYTRERNVLIGVFTADCVPILLYDPMEHIIAAIHSGWIGTTKAIVSKTLDVLRQKEGCLSENILAYIGPAIAYQSFEIGMEVVDQIKALPFDTSPYLRMKNEQKAYADNKGLNRQMLLNAGVLREHITVDPNDTFIDNEVFFSYRRDKQCGRHLSFIVQR